MDEMSVKEAIKALIKERPERNAFNNFKQSLKIMLKGMEDRANETEEYFKNILSDFLKNTWYSGNYFINTSGRIDLVVSGHALAK